MQLKEFANYRYSCNDRIKVVREASYKRQTYFNRNLHYFEITNLHKPFLTVIKVFELTGTKWLKRARA